MERIVLKTIVLLALLGSYAWFSNYQENQLRPEKVSVSLEQLGSDANLDSLIANDHAWRNQVHVAGWLILGVVGMILFSTEIRAIGAHLLSRRVAVSSAECGGSLTEAVNLTGLFIDEGPVVQVKASRGEAEHYDDMDRGMAWKGPLVVLTSKFSASASEIFAGAIQDYHRGIVVGDTSTHGKGTVQSLRELGRELFGGKGPNLGALKITMQQFYRPNGDSTQLRGVLADVVLPSLTDVIEGVSESDLEWARPFDKVPANTYSKYNQVTSEILGQLRAHSAERIKASADFDKLKRIVARYKEQNLTKEVPLNEEKFLAQRKEIDADRELEKQFEDQANGNKSGDVVKRDYYFNEVLALTVDYLKLLGQNTIARVN